MIPPGVILVAGYLAAFLVNDVGNIPLGVLEEVVLRPVYIHAHRGAVPGIGIVDDPQNGPVLVPDYFPGDVAAQQGVLMGSAVDGLPGAKAVFVVLVTNREIFSANALELSPHLLGIGKFSVSKEISCIVIGQSFYAGGDAVFLLLNLDKPIQIVCVDNLLCCPPLCWSCSHGCRSRKRLPV